MPRRKTEYISFHELSKTQEKVQLYIQHWVKTEKTIVPHQKIVAQMRAEGVKDSTIVDALKVLKRKGYVRKAIITSNKTFYVLLRTI